MKQFDSTLASAEDVMSYTGLPALALIPAGNVNGRRWLSQKILLRLRRRQRESALALTSDLRSPAAEAYRHLRASLLYGVPGSSPRKILVTSGSPYEGKTTTAINTAVTLAQNGAQVLLIDCDLRRPQVHNHFELPNSEGLTTYLSGQRDIDSLIQSSELCPNLKLLTAGPTTANPAEFLGSTEMRKLLRSLDERYDHVVIDSSPASAFADASIISTEVDAVILVVHSELSSRSVVRRVKERLQAVGASISGVVLNHVDLASDKYYSGYYTDYQ
jgi:capsular exopolysaccharide synthesis family protein